VGKSITVKESVAKSIAEIAWYIESQGLLTTAENFADHVYDFFTKLADSRRIHAICRDPDRARFGYKCVVYKKKYTAVFLETDVELIICEFIPSRLVHW
jgi:hypothetical protein